MSNATLNVVTVDSVGYVNTAIGNSATVGTEGGDLRADVKQVDKGDVGAKTTLNVTGYAGTTVLQTSAYGNTGEAVATDGAGLSGGFSQDVAAGHTVSAETKINAYGGDLGPETSVQTTAVGNTQGIGIDGGGTASVLIGQRNAGSTQASNGATFQYTAGEVDLAATAASNNITATGTVGSSQIINATQKMTGAQTLAYSEVDSGNAQTINNVATASANNMSANNDGGPLDMAVSQTNKGYVRAQTTNVAYEFGSNNAMSYGVGNSLTAGETGIELSLDANQVNRGSVDAVSSVSGTTGYDSSSTSVAMGNAVTGFACSSCGGTIDVNSRQVNSGDIGSSSTIGVAGSGRSVTGSSTAVGNSATYYVSRPGG